MRIYFTILAGLVGLAFGSFLNVCLSRWPQGESIVKPRSHCRACGRTLTWWENVPLVSWLALRGRCRTCGVWIGWRYPLVELAVGGLWTLQTMMFFENIGDGGLRSPILFYTSVADLILQLALLWVLVALAVLDAEHLWLPDKLTITWTILGVIAAMLILWLRAPIVLEHYGASGLLRRLLFDTAWKRLLAILVAAGLILLIRWLYWLIRRREGIGLGDAKLMALLAAWLGLPGALLAFAIGVIVGSVVGVVVIVRSPRPGVESPALAKLPLGTFLCIGGIVASLWGQPILAAYLRYAGLQ